MIFLSSSELHLSKMSLRNSVRRGSALFSSYFRNYSSSGPLINVAVNEKTGVATATLNRPPVNSLNLELLTEISNTLSQLEKNKCRGLILTSVIISFFFQIIFNYCPKL